MLKIVGVIQCRTGSKRFPSKVLEYLSSSMLFELVYERVLKARVLSDVVFAIPDGDEKLRLELERRNISFVTGSENDVLSRFCEAIRSKSIDVCVRITADCPLVHPQIIDALVELYLATGKEYVSNIYPRSFPDGLDIEVFDANRLLQMNEIEERLDYREHVTKGFREDSSIPRFGLVSSLNLENIRLTVDYPEDLDFLRRLISAHPLLLNSSISELLQIIKLYNEKAFED